MHLDGYFYDDYQDQAGDWLCCVYRHSIPLLQTLLILIIPFSQCATMAPQIKLTYFHIPGRGELARLTFAAAGITVEDERVTYEQFRNLKPSLPLRKVPTLTVDGVTYVQSLAHMRYAGRLGGLYPTDVVEALKVDEIMDSLNEVYVAIVDIWSAPLKPRR